nr:F0F1 ATP synthase subunit A [Oscillospiraceae bacterium]
MDLSVNGPKVYFELPFDLPDINIFTMKNLITQSTITLFAVTLILIIAAIAVTRRITKRPGRIQVLVEKLITMLYNLVEDTMGKHNLKFAPYIGTLFLSSICGTLLGMTQIFRSATADLSVTAAWALVTTGMVWYHNIKNFGFKAWLKGFTEPIVVMTPMNIVSEIANPVSMAFRHFGNVAGGSVLTALIYSALAALSNLILGWIPGIIGEIPFFQVGIPAFLSIYFDLFSGFVQALVFSLLTMVYVGGACPPPEEMPEARRAILEKRAAKKANKKA